MQSNQSDHAMHDVLQHVEVIFSSNCYVNLELLAAVPCMRVHNVTGNKYKFAQIVFLNLSYSSMSGDGPIQQLAEMTGGSRCVCRCVFYYKSTWLNPAFPQHLKYAVAPMTMFPSAKCPEKILLNS